jgi:hypothetical protein
MGLQTGITAATAMAPGFWPRPSVIKVLAGAAFLVRELQLCCEVLPCRGVLTVLPPSTTSLPSSKRL